MILGSVPLAALLWFFTVMGGSIQGPEGFGVVLIILCICAFLAILSVIATVLAFRKRPASGLDTPARILSISMVVVYAIPGACGIMICLWWLYSVAAMAVSLIKPGA